MRILPLVVLVACLASGAWARPQDDAEPRGVNRGLLKRGLVGKGKTTTTTPAPQEEVEYEDEGDYPAEGEAQEPSTEAAPSSTEGKKLVAGGIRPFRSNTDLLEALKRRRLQAAEAKSSGSPASQHSENQPEAPAKANYNKKRFNTATRETKAEDAPAPAPAAAPAPAKPSRGRFGRPSSRSIQESELEEQNDATPSARTGRNFSRRGN
ncbi:unnamed protein product, partial [Brenthis ino]